MRLVKRNRRLLIVAGITAAAALAVWAWYATRRPFDPADFGTLAGTVKSADEQGSGKSRYLEFYLVESPVRFRVPIDGYREGFQREAFFANVRPGDRVTLEADKAMLAQPFFPPLDPVPTVFVHGLRDERMAYCTLAGRQRWVENNQFYGMLVAVGLSITAVVLAILGLRPMPVTSPENYRLADTDPREDARP